MTSTKISTLLTYAALAVFLLICGASLFEHAALATSWTQDPPTSLRMFHGEYRVAPERFFRIVHPILIVLLAGGLASSWKNEQRRKSLLFVCVGYVIAFIVTRAYFAPELTSVLEGVPPIGDEAVRSRALMWEKLALVRTAWMLLFAVPLMRATTQEPS